MSSEMLARLLTDPVASDQTENDGLHAGDGSVDIRGNPVLRSNTGTWKACRFILGTELCERLAYYGIVSNLVSYLTINLHEGNVSAATNVTTWQGTCYLTPLIGAVLADASWGRYRTIGVFSIIYFIGMLALTLSASIPFLKPPECIGSECPSATTAQYAVFFSGLYLIALGTGGIKPCVSSFGADQFDDTDPEEKVSKSSFFNWFYFAINIGAFLSSSVIVWIQDNEGWGLGYGIPTFFMGLATVLFFFGTSRYRFQRPGGSPVTRICQVVVASYRKLNLAFPVDSSSLYETPARNSKGSRKLEHTDNFKFLDRAAIISDGEERTLGVVFEYSNRWSLCTVTQVEELKLVIRMLPICAAGIVFSVVYAQMSTIFVEQAMVMDTSLGSFHIPAGFMSTFDVFSVIIFVVIYERFIIPFAKRITGEAKGITELQRMGIGFFISVLCMSVAAVVETRRLALATEFGLVDKSVVVPMSIFWQTPQFILLGIAESCVFVGQLEFFYDQSPDAMRSFCSALALVTISLGNYLSSFILTLVKSCTTRGGRTGWIPDNLNQGHLDYFFWLLAGLSFLNFVVYRFSAKWYKPKIYRIEESSIEESSTEESSKAESSSKEESSS